MNRKELEKYLKSKCPTMRIERTDAMGTRHSRHYINAIVPHLYAPEWPYAGSPDTASIAALESAAIAVGRRAAWPHCSAVYGTYRVIEVSTGASK